jgi:hypothetical protein
MSSSAVIRVTRHRLRTRSAEGGRGAEGNPPRTEFYAVDRSAAHDYFENRSGKPCLNYIII